MRYGGEFLDEVLIFSRDRALQLDGLLRSFLLHNQDPGPYRIHVLYKSTKDLHAHQYEQLARLYNDQLQIKFLHESNFRTDVLNVLSPEFKSVLRGSLYRWLIKGSFRFGSFANSLLRRENLSDKYILFLVDDSLFIHPFSLHEVSEMLTRSPQALGFSLRLGMNTTYCYMLDTPQALPIFEALTDRVMSFDWTVGDKDFGYPLEVSSSVYRLGDILPLLNQLPFQHPNSLEARLAYIARNFQETHPCLLCYRQSVAFADPVNKVQTVYQNRAGAHCAYDVEKLAHMFADGYRLNVKAYAGLTPNACHQEVELIFDKSQGMK